MTQATDVKPLIQVATYIEEETGFHHYQEIAGRTFMPLKEVPTPSDQPKNHNKLQLEVMNSKFVKFQEIKLQERADEVNLSNDRFGINFLVFSVSCTQVWVTQYRRFRKEKLPAS